MKSTEYAALAGAFKPTKKILSPSYVLAVVCWKVIALLVFLD